MSLALEYVLKIRHESFLNMNHVSTPLSLIIEERRRFPYMISKSRDMTLPAGPWPSGLLNA